jgi:hypothetical protein
MPLTRLFAVLAGFLILGCATWAVIDSAKLTGAHAALVCSLAVGTSVGAFVMARSHWLAGLAIALAVVCGEGYGMLMTAERIVAMREAAQSPARQVAEQRTKAKDRLQSAEAALAAAPTTSRRLEAATAAKGEADRAAIAKAAEKSCSENCRKLLEAAVASSKAELDEARREIVGERERMAAAVETDRTVLAGLQMPSSTGTALADRLGLAPWLLDLMAACLLTLGANGLAAVLIAWGSHVALTTPVPPLKQSVPRPASEPAARASEPAEETQALKIEAAPEPSEQPADIPNATIAFDQSTPQKQPEAVEPSNQTAVAQPEPTTNVTPLVVGSIARFLLQGVAPAEGSRVELVELFVGYRRWCHVYGLAPVGAERFADQLSDVCAKAGIMTRRARGKVFVVDVSLALPLSASG